MNRISFKLLSVLAIFLFIAVAPIVIFAANEDVSIVSTINDEAKTEYIIYIKDYSNQKFKFAFTTNANPGEMDLSYINSISDLGENQAAFLDAATYEKLSKESSTIYIWAKDEENLILKGIQLDFTKVLTKETLEDIETITTKINVEIADSEEDTTTVRNETVDGVEEVANVGYVKILDDDKKATYYHETIKIADSEEHEELMLLVEEINNEYEEMDMYEKVQFATKFNALYSKLANEVDWKKVEEKTIKQPEESVNGDKYIVFLRKIDKQGVETIDAQFLTAYDDYKPNVVIEEIITQETTKLPITYDSIALFVVLGVIVLLVVLVFIRMKKLKKQNEEK